MSVRRGVTEIQNKKWKDIARRPTGELEDKKIVVGPLGFGPRRAGISALQRFFIRQVSK